jgi:hypothetical protein
MGGIRMWRVDANIVNKNSVTAERGDPPYYELAGSKQLEVKIKQRVTKC